MAGPPPRTVIQAPRFAKAKRRFPPEAQLHVDEAVRGVFENPLLGAPKTGGLKGIRVVKFKVGPTQLLLAYEFHVKLNRIDLLDVGPHENFYRDLQKYSGAK